MPTSKHNRKGKRRPRGPGNRDRTLSGRPRDPDYQGNASGQEGLARLYQELFGTGQSAPRGEPVDLEQPMGMCAKCLTVHQDPMDEETWEAEQLATVSRSLEAHGLEECGDRGHQRAALVWLTQGVEPGTCAQCGRMVTFEIGEKVDRSEMTDHAYETLPPDDQGRMREIDHRALRVQMDEGPIRVGWRSELLEYD